MLLFYLLLTASSTRLLDHDIHTLFKEGSFDKFTEDMVRQFMKEEALQAQHQVEYLYKCTNFEPLENIMIFFYDIFLLLYLLITHHKVFGLCWNHFVVSITNLARISTLTRQFADSVLPMCQFKLEHQIYQDTIRDIGDIGGCMNNIQQ